MKKNNITTFDYIKAHRIARREIDIDNGCVCLNKIHKTNKTYSRKIKHKNR